MSSVCPAYKNACATNAILPISLLNTISKLCEAIIVKHLNKKKLLSDKLYSFCYSRSTVDIKIVITYRISKALDNKNISRVFTLDIFDKVYHKGLLHVCQLWNLWDSPLGHQVLPVKVIIKGQSSKAHEVSADIPSPKAHFLVLPSFSFVLMISLGTF